MIAGGASDKAPGAPGGPGTQFIFDAGSADGFPGGADMIALGNDIEGGHGVWGRNGRHHARSRGAGQGDLINRLDVERAFAGVIERDKQGRAAISGGDDDPRIPRGALADFIADEIKRRDRRPV